MERNWFAVVKGRTRSFDSLDALKAIVRTSFNSICNYSLSWHGLKMAQDLKGNRKQCPTAGMETVLRSMYRSVQNEMEDQEKNLAGRASKKVQF